jgi:hypothetical protein
MYRVVRSPVSRRKHYEKNYGNPCCSLNSSCVAGICRQLGRKLGFRFNRYGLIGLIGEQFRFNRYGLIGLIGEQFRFNRYRVIGLIGQRFRFNRYRIFIGSFKYRFGRYGFGRFDFAGYENREFGIGVKRQRDVGPDIERYNPGQ